LLSPDRIAGIPEDSDHIVLPFPVIRLINLPDAVIPDLREDRIVGTECPDILDAPCPPAGMVKN
jgi:hypothetical protein